ncbi:MAG: HlyD family type I secretion periplasmic adaptor subunit [Hyphomicrobiaceae bacterium]
MTATVELHQTLRSLRRLQRFGTIVVVLLAIGIGGWAANTDIAGAVIASGQIVVESDTKKVQHIDGGIVGEIRARDGDRVEAGQLLLRLDATVLQANMTIVSAQLNELFARRARLVAERDGQSILRLPMRFAGGRIAPGLQRALMAEEKLFKLRGQSRLGKKQQLEQRRLQIEETLSGLKIQVAAKREEVELIAKELKGARKLHRKGLMAIGRLTSLERQRTRTQGELGNLIASIGRSRAQLAETQLQDLQIDQDFATSVANELRDIEIKVGELRERKVTANAKLKRIEIRAPVSGVVTRSLAHTIGGVVAPGETIMEVVPQDDSFVVEAQINPRDIDQVRLDQPVVLRFSALNQRTTPELSGTVERISPDTMVDKRGSRTFYITRIRIEDNELKRLGRVGLIPGMPVEAFMKTQDRSVLSYLFKPLTDQFHRVFRES